MAHEIIFHHYWNSPFSEKARLLFGIKGLSWRSVIQPTIMPKPDLIPLTGGYRKIPVMQIGADIYCDSAIIMREIERRFPEPSALPAGKGMPFSMPYWTDRVVFGLTIPVIFGEIGHMIPEEFKKDRTAMSGAPFDTEAMKGAIPYARDQLRVHFGLAEDQLADGRKFILGERASVADSQVFMNFWFLRSAVPHLFPGLVEEFPQVRGWIERLDAIGHGTATEMDPKEALAVAKAATPEAKPAVDPHDTTGIKPGAKVHVTADDYGKDPIAGQLVFANLHEIAVLRHDPDVGDIVVHVPRLGFVLSPA